MKFKNIYLESRDNVELSLLSHWTPGAHRMRGAMLDLFRREPLMADPVFQSIFPWQETDHPDWRSLLHPSVVSMIDERNRGRKDPFVPFRHQTRSWEALKWDAPGNNSLVVTSGTGSGKTECFMYPVLGDLCSRQSAVGGTPVEALFLYPLNALMQDQKDRLGRDCERLGLRFAVYNSSLRERKAKTRSSYPAAEVMTRERVRGEVSGQTSCPNILLTNPSMLEFMLVRDKDKPIFERSKGRLRWIVIDEAHTYTGSAAVELACLLKRVLEAFGVKREDVRFVCTSATIGDRSKPSELTDFIEAIIGPYPAGSRGRLMHIDGDRAVPRLAEADVQRELDAAGVTDTTARRVLALRQRINTAPMELGSIWKLLSAKPYSLPDALGLLDTLCEIRVGGQNLLMLRGNFFMRAIDGLYACVNGHCPGAGDDRQPGFRYLTTYKADGRCPHCGAPLFEVVQCGDCKEFILKCDESDTHALRQTYSAPGMVSIEREDDDSGDDDTTDGGTSDGGWTRTYLSWYGGGRPYAKPNPEYVDTRFSMDWDGRVMTLGRSGADLPWVALEEDDRQFCPTCSSGSGADGSRFHNFRLSVDWLNGTVAPALLHEGKDALNEWGKYIAFTDSRQGTAVKAKRFNIESERAFARTRLLKELYSQAVPPNLQTAFDNLLNSGFDRARALAILGVNAGRRTMTLREAADCIFDRDIFDHVDYESSQGSTRMQQASDTDAYQASLLRSVLGRRPMHQANIESLGLVRLVYPKIDGLNQKPAAWPFSTGEWKDFLKICIDYVIRAGNHFQKPLENEYQYLRDSEFSSPFNPDRWPSVKMDGTAARARQSRLVLLLCAAMGITDTATLAGRAAEVNAILSEALDFLKNNILTPVRQGDPYGDEYLGWLYLDMSPTSDKCRVTAIDSAWRCPVTSYVLDTVFHGYSPMMTGCLCPENMGRFAVRPAPDVTMPAPGGTDFDARCAALRSQGLWNDRLKWAYRFPATAYLTAEHSGQQNRDVLDHYTGLFKASPHKLNVLQCSTTMEMGVDIGDIDTVLMTNIPPTTANYLQRAGRAGRRGQSKAAAFTFCPVNSSGAQVFSNPVGLLTGVSPAIRPKESQIIIQRHINSFLIRQFLLSPEGNRVAFSRVHDWLGQGGSADDFIMWMGSHRSDAALSAAFTDLFGTGRTLAGAMDAAEDVLTDIILDYRAVLGSVNAAIATTNDPARQRALSIQEETIRNQELKGYLAERQFLPNANMPTGIVEFNYMNSYWAKELNTKKAELERKRQRLAAPGLTAGQTTRLHDEIADLETEMDNIRERNTTQREIKLALSEYAPGQTLVIDERNHVSAGIEWTNSLGQQHPIKYLYHCPNCGRYEYCDDQSLAQCPSCGGPLEGIIAPNSTRYSFAIEPSRFRADVNRGVNRKEKTSKTYYDIKTILTSVEWGSAIAGPMCDLVGSDGSDGQIVFYNQGNGTGFDLCLDCGRMEPSRPGRTGANWQHHSIDEIQDDNTFCPANNVWNQVLLSGRFPTSFVSLRFYEDSSRTVLVRDEELLCSLGAIITRALAQHIGVDRSDLDFEVRDEHQYKSVFIYDTMKGGCGYSTRLLDPATLGSVFALAGTMLSSFTCNCERNETGACVNCLVDVNTRRVEDRLSKYKLMRWFASQTMNTLSGPNGAAACPVPLRYLLASLMNDRGVSSITLCADAGDIQLSEWTSRDGAIGRLLLGSVNKGKKVTVKVAGVPQAAAGTPVDSLVPFMSITQQFGNIGVAVEAVDSIETAPGIQTALIVDGTDHYFTDQADMLLMGSDWGRYCTRLFEDNNVPSFSPLAFPTFSDIIALLKPDEVIRAVEIPSGTKTRIDGVLTLLRGQFHPGDDQDIRGILSGKKVDILFSDAYVNSALAALMLVYLIKNMKDTYGFEVGLVALKLRSPRRKCVNDMYSDRTYIQYNFPDERSADDFILGSFNDFLGITPGISQFMPDHHRWLRFQPRGGSSYVEIRPDHGVGGGWKCNEQYADLDLLDGRTGIEVNDEQLPLYYVMLKK